MQNKEKKQLEQEEKGNKFIIIETRNKLIRNAILCNGNFFLFFFYLN